MSKTTGNPFLDFDVTKLVAEFKLPGIDLDALFASQRKNIEAVAAANQLAAEGVQAVFRRQSEILRQAMEEANAMVAELVKTSAPEEKMVRQTELAKAALDKALANMKELAEMVARSNTEASDVISRRFSESLEELKGAIAKASKK